MKIKSSVNRQPPTANRHPSSVNRRPSSVIPVFDSPQIHLRNRSYHQRNFFNNGLVTVNAISFGIGLSEFDDAEIRIQYKSFPEPEFIVVRQEPFQDHEPEIIGSLCT